MTDPKALKGTSPNHWAGVLGVQRGRGQVVLLKDTCVEQQGGVRDSKGKDKGSCRGYGDAGLSTWQGGTCLGRAPWHQVKDPLGNSYFYKRCVFIKKKNNNKKRKTENMSTFLSGLHDWAGITSFVFKSPHCFSLCSLKSSWGAL